MMNGVNMLRFVVRRMFSKKSIRPKISGRSRNPKMTEKPKTLKVADASLVGIRGKIKLTEDEKDMANVEIFDPEDINEFESDFMNVHESHKMYQWYALYQKLCM